MYGDRFVLSTHSIGFTDSISHQISELNEYIPSEMKEHDWNDVEILLGQLKIAKSKLKPNQLTIVETWNKKLAEHKRELLLARVDDGNINNNKLSPTTAPIASQQNSLIALQQARVQLHDTEQVAISTLENLQLQGEKMQQVKTKLKDMDNSLDQSSSLLARMSRWWRS